MNKKYKVEVKTERNGKDTYLSMTQDGYFWTSISIDNPALEIPLIISALQRHLTPDTPDSEDQCHFNHAGLLGNYCSNCGKKLLCK